MQTREETNTDASLGNTPLAVPLATERNPSKRGCRGICSLAKCSGSQVSVLRYDVLMPGLLPRHRDVEQCFCVTAIFDVDVSVGSKAERLSLSKCCPLYPRKRTNSRRFYMSA